MSKLKNTEYTDVLPNYKDWPIFELNERKNEFIQDVVEESLSRITQGKSAMGLFAVLEKTCFREKERIEVTPWTVDPSDDASFWEGIDQDINANKHLSSEEGFKVYAAIIRKIILRYAQEIFSGFEKSKFNFAARIVHFTLGRLLSAVRAKSFFNLFQKGSAEKKIKINGDIEHLRKLAISGTVILLPTHFSNLDSVLIGWFLRQIGLPPFVYGAGLNLFNYPFFGYFMKSLGAYKVDRRKKNSIYLSTLVSYSALAIEMGCHSVFFPGGTRCRSGKIESHLKLGLLSSIVQAQRWHLEKRKEGHDAKKIYIVPLSLNYNSVLESPMLIRQHLQKEGKDQFHDTNKKGSIPYKVRTFLHKFFTKETEISVTVGAPRDFFGNKIDKDGNSVDRFGRKVDILDYFINNDGKIVKDLQRDQEYTKLLGKIIAKSYRNISQIFSSHLVAFVAFKMMKSQYPQESSIYDFFRLPNKSVIVDYNDFKERVIEVRDFLLDKEKEGEVTIGASFKKDIDTVIKIGIDNVGMYHAKRPLLFLKQKTKIYSQDFMTLYYYHNRLDAFGYEELND